MDRRTDGQTDRTNRLTPPHTRGVINIASYLPLAAVGKGVDSLGMMLVTQPFLQVALSGLEIIFFGALILEDK